MNKIRNHLRNHNAGDNRLVIFVLHSRRMNVDSLRLNSSWDIHGKHFSDPSEERTFVNMWGLGVEEVVPAVRSIPQRVDLSNAIKVVLVFFGHSLCDCSPDSICCDCNRVTLDFDGPLDSTVLLQECQRAQVIFF
jgi:hypothetical protein